MAVIYMVRRLIEGVRIASKLVYASYGCYLYGASVNRGCKDSIKTSFTMAVIYMVRRLIEGVRIASKLVYATYHNGCYLYGASVNRGCKDSIKTSLRDLSQWLLFIWCVG